MSERIVAQGKVVHRGNKWTIAKRNQRYAIYGDDPADTLTAMKAFAEHELVKYLNSVWGTGSVNSMPRLTRSCTRRSSAWLSCALNGRR